MTTAGRGWAKACAACAVCAAGSIGVALLGGCAGSSGTPRAGSPAASTSPGVQLSPPSPEWDRGDRGPVRTDLPPLTSRFPALGTPVAATWQGGVLGDRRAPGPSTYWIEAVVTVPPQTAAALAARVGPPQPAAPSVAAPLAAALPDGPWSAGPALDEAFATGEFSGNVFLAADDAVVVLLMIGGS